MGTDSATVLLDLKKFYEHITHPDFFAAAGKYDFNLNLLRGLVAISSGFGVLFYDGAVSDFLKASGAVIAGCSTATTLAELLLLGPLTNAISGKLQLRRIRNVVDDISLQSFGPSG